MPSSIRRLRTLILGLSSSLVIACTPHDAQQLDAKVAAHDSMLQDIPRDFYEPGLGDLMHALQLRHAKLWFAGQAENWDLAEFELEEIRENLDRVTRWHADNEDIPLPAAMKAYTKEGVYALDQSIRKRDASTFVLGFDALTQGCNGCHETAKHGFIVIRRPTIDPVGNQTWTPSSDER